MQIGQNEKERGASLVEALAALAVGSLLTLVVIQLLLFFAQIRQEKFTAQYLDKIGDAALAYMGSAALADHIPRTRIHLHPEKGGLAHGEEIAVLQLIQLRAAGILPARFPMRGPFGAETEIRLRAYHKQSGPRMLQAVIKVQTTGLTEGRAARILQQSRHIAGYVRMRTEAEVQTYYAQFSNGRRLEGEALVEMAGGEFAGMTEGFIILRELPLRPLAPAQKSLTGILGEALDAVAGAKEAEINDRLAAFDFVAANAGRDLAVRETREISANGEEVTVYQTPVHVCPEGFEPTMQVYPRAADLEAILAETRLHTGAPTSISLRTNSGPQTGAGQHYWWAAAGIFRHTPMEIRGESGAGLRADAPVNIETALDALPPPAQFSGPLAALADEITAHRQGSRFWHQGGSWHFTRLAAFDGLGMDLSPLPSTGDWYFRDPCDSLETCARGVSAKGWLAQHIKHLGPPRRRRFSINDQEVALDFIYGWPKSGSRAEACSMVLARTGRNRLRWLASPSTGTMESASIHHQSAQLTEGNPLLNLALCRHLPAADLQIIRKCVPDTKPFYRGIDLVLTPPE